MEVRIEDNLTLSNADIVTLCIYDASDETPSTEAGIKWFLNRLDELFILNYNKMIYSLFLSVYSDL